MSSFLVHIPPIELSKSARHRIIQSSLSFLGMGICLVSNNERP